MHVDASYKNDISDESLTPKCTVSVTKYSEEGKHRVCHFWVGYEWRGVVVCHWKLADSYDLWKGGDVATMSRYSQRSSQ